MFAQFLSSQPILLVTWFFYDCSQDLFVCILASFKTFYEKKAVFHCFSSTESHVFGKEKLGLEVWFNYYNKAHCSNVRFRKLFQSLPSKWYHELQKATGAIQKKAILPEQQTWETSLLLGRFKVQLIYTPSLWNICYHQFISVVERFWSSSVSVEKIFSMEKRKSFSSSCKFGFCNPNE